MGAMKKLFITCILVGTFVPLFQNCGQKSYGNGDPYEEADSQSVIDIGPDFNNEEQTSNYAGVESRKCTGKGEIKQVTFVDLFSGKEMISFTTNLGKQRSVVRSYTPDLALSLDVLFDSGVKIKSLNIFSNSVTIGVEISGVLSYEQLTCVVY